MTETTPGYYFGRRSIESLNSEIEAWKREGVAGMCPGDAAGVRAAVQAMLDELHTRALAMNADAPVAAALDGRIAALRAESTGRPFDYLTDRQLFDTVERALNLPVGGQLPASEYLTALITECHVRALVDYDADIWAEREFSTLETSELNNSLAFNRTLPRAWLAGRRSQLLLTELRLRALSACPYYVEQGEIDPVTGMTVGQIKQEIIKVRSDLNGTLSDAQRASDTAWLNRLVAEESARRAIDDDADKELFKALRFLMSVGIDTGTKYEAALRVHGL